MGASDAKITKIEVKGLWNLFDLVWEVTPEVNVLAGTNGSGKSTILKCLADMFTLGSITSKHGFRMEAIGIEFDNGVRVNSLQKFDPTPYNVQVISTFDMTLQQSEAVHKLSDGTVTTYLDWEIYRLQNRYLTYQLDLGKKVIAALQQGKEMPDIASITNKKALFYDILDELFESTGKIADRESDILKFRLNRGQGIEILPHQLSSGEKQILIILANVLTQAERPFIMIMDEPEISLHFDWQKRLIEDMLLLNKNLQLIVATHSPAMVMKGWIDRVHEISDLLKPLGTVNFA